jgi:hypothetical protein
MTSSGEAISAYGGSGLGSADMRGELDPEETGAGGSSGTNPDKDNPGVGS